MAARASQGIASPASHLNNSTNSNVKLKLPPIENVAETKRMFDDINIEDNVDLSFWKDENRGNNYDSDSVSSHSNISTPQSRLYHAGISFSPNGRNNGTKSRNDQFEDFESI